MEINEIVLEVIALARSEVLSNGVSLQTQLANGLPLVHGDRIQLQQVILNLVVNAIEATSSTSEGARELLIGTGKDASDAVLVAVRDSGPGLDPEGLGRLFDAFYTTKPGGIDSERQPRAENAHRQEAGSSRHSRRLPLGAACAAANAARRAPDAPAAFRCDHRRRAGKVLAGPVPLGYAVVDKKIVVIPAEAETVRGAAGTRESSLTIKSDIEHVRSALAALSAGAVAPHRLSPVERPARIAYVTACC